MPLWAASTRLFTYDNLGQLIASSQPEYTSTPGSQNNYTFGDDNEGSLTSRTDPRGFLTCYFHDSLNRQTQLNYLAAGACPFGISDPTNPTNPTNQSRSLMPPVALGRAN